MPTSTVPLRILLQLSWRNLWRHRRRNGMLLAAIVVAVATIVLANSLIRGWQAQMLETVVDNLTGHVAVHATGYRDDPSIQRALQLPPNFNPQLDGTEMLGWASRVRVPGVILSERDTRGVQVVGIDPAEELIVIFMTQLMPSYTFNFRGQLKSLVYSAVE